jgi:hypothetical protein
MTSQNRDTHTVCPNPGIKAGDQVTLVTDKGSLTALCTGATAFQAYFKGHGLALGKIFAGASKGTPVSVEIEINGESKSSGAKDELEAA